ncbi:MAG: hypothetical protein H6696_12880 [Deferribacteres bacterium]|nr:hypothetical protein [candidate division KSB1 bacterium]MCB9502823.1 hypothetical protein [Deferribacteres bacterium]
MSKTNKWLHFICGAQLLVPAFVFAQSGLNIHGHLMQAFAISDKHQVYGIPTSGTTDYRNLALQIRYDSKLNSSFVVQLSHKRLGGSPYMQVEPNVAFDWGFYEYKISDESAVRIGKILYPLGIYNELRDVGILLPFYRVPSTVYGERGHTSETIDGFSYSHTFRKNARWEMNLSVFGGHWSMLEMATFSNPYTGEDMQIIEEARSENGLGTQLWLMTPLEGLRFGSGIVRSHLSGGINFNENYGGKERDIWGQNYSMDCELERVSLKTEYVRYDLNGMDFNIGGAYVQAGFVWTEKLRTFAKWESSFLNAMPVPPPFIMAVGSNKMDLTNNNDTSLGFNYSFAQNIVFKFEIHWYEGFNIEEKSVNLFVEEPYRTRFSIISFATGF